MLESEPMFMSVDGSIGVSVGLGLPDLGKAPPGVDGSEGDEHPTGEVPAQGFDLFEGEEHCADGESDEAEED